MIHKATVTIPMEWTTEANARLVQYLMRDGYEIPRGLGTEEAACSVAAINLALTGKLTESIPDCMSSVIGNWIISVQYAMPGDIRNSPEWKALLPLAAGSGQHLEVERLNVIMDWMWQRVLPYAQPIADKHDFGAEWVEMCNQRTESSAAAATVAADRAADAAYFAGYAAGHAKEASHAADRAAEAAHFAGYATIHATAARAGEAARAAARAAAAYAAYAYAAYAANHAAWDHFDPIGLLRLLIEVSE